ncbi:MAG: hypothetical protein SGBAC_010948 [Bacillariaceae sp.]
MTPATRTPSSSSSSETRPSMNTVFSKQSTSSLTREEECMLKTALAMVVVKQRQKAATGHFQQAKTAQKQARIASEGLLDRIFAQNPSPSNRSSLLLLSHRQHLERIFQAAVSMSANNHNNHDNHDAINPNSTLQQDSGIDVLRGTCCHLACQLQTWLHEEEEEEGEQERVKTTTTAAAQDGDENRARNEKASKEECSHWIRQSLMTTPCRATFQVYYHLLEGGNTQLNGVVLNILIKLLLEAYHDRLVLPSHNNDANKPTTKNCLKKAPPTTTTTTTTTTSIGSNGNRTKLDKNKNHESIDWLTVSWLRLTHRCVQYLPPNELQSILHNSSALAHLLLPLETSGGATTTTSTTSTATTSTSTPSLIQTFWEMSTVPTVRVAATVGISPFPRTTTIGKPPTRLGTGAKMLLRLGLYRLLYYNMSPEEGSHNNNG